MERNDSPIDTSVAMLRNATARSGARKHISASSLDALGSHIAFQRMRMQSWFAIINGRKDTVGPILSLGSSFGD